MVPAANPDVPPAKEERVVAVDTTDPNTSDVRQLLSDLVRAVEERLDGRTTSK